ncbi:MAG: hypothetical protein R3C39_06805 [Dehalococcoidia bacterium]
MLALVTPFARLWLRFLRYPWSRLRRGVFERRWADAPLPRATSIEDVSALLSEIEWVADGPLHLFDAVSRPASTWARRRDDCDGFASVAARLLEGMSPATRPVLVTVVTWPLAKSHTVCAFRDLDDGSWRTFDNARLLEDRFASVDDVARRVAQRGARVLCWDVVEPRELRRLRYSRDL